MGPALALLAVVGCAGGSEPCSVDRPDRGDTLASWNCNNARVLAIRHAEGLYVTQPEADAFLEAHLRAFDPIASTLGYPPLAQ